MNRAAASLRLLQLSGGIFNTVSGDRQGLVAGAQPKVTGRFAWS